MLENSESTLTPTGVLMATGKVDDIFEKNFMTAAKFSVEIEKIVKDSNLNYIEAIVQFCEDKNIEMDGINKLISKPLKEKLKFDAQRLNYMKRTSKAFLKLWTENQENKHQKEKFALLKMVRVELIKE